MAAESKIEKYLRTEVAKLGGWMEKHVSPGTKGPPDDIVWWPQSSEGGMHCIAEMLPHARPFLPRIAVAELVEVKAPTGTAQVLQQRDHRRRRGMGFIVHVTHTKEQADTYLKSRGKK